MLLMARLLRRKRWLLCILEVASLRIRESRVVISFLVYFHAYVEEAAPVIPRKMNR